MSFMVRTFRSALLALVLVLATPPLAAQVRERPVAFDSAGRILSLTPPLVARLGLAAPVWPVSGDFLDARLYEIGDSLRTYVIVVRRQREELERFPLDAAARERLAGAIALSIAASPGAGTRDSLPTYISEPVRGQFVLNQTLLGLTVFGPAAATIVQDPIGSSAAYLLVAGVSFFYSAALTQSTPVSRAQNHLATHSAFRGALAGNLAMYTLFGDDADEQAHAGAILVGGILGDVVGFRLAKPMTDAEAHGTAHGSTVTALLTTGLLGTAGAFRDEGSARAATAGILVAGAAGYPLGLRYVRTAPYRVTAGDVGAMFTSELLGLAAATTVIPDDPSGATVFGLLTAGYAAGAILGDRLLVRPFDHTETDARLLGVGTAAGALMGLAVPLLAQADDARLWAAAGTIGGVLGAIATESFIKPARARGTNDSMQRTGSLRLPGRVDLQFSPQAAIFAGSGIRGNHSVVSLTF